MLGELGNLFNIIYLETSNKGHLYSGVSHKPFAKMGPVMYHAELEKGAIIAAHL